MIDAADEMVNNPQLPSRIPLDLQIDWNAEMVPLVRVNASPAWRGNIETEFDADFVMEKAINRPLAPETIIKQLQRTGGTPFIIRNISMNYPGDLFTPIGNLNHLRRQILEKIKDKILEAYRPSSEEIEATRNQLVQLKKDLNLEELHSEELNLEESNLVEPNLVESNSEELPLKNYHLEDGSAAVDSDLNRVDLNQVKTHSQPIKLAIYVDCTSSLEAALQAGCKRIYFQPKIEIDRGNRFQEIFSCLKHNHDYDAYFKMMGLSLLEAANLCQEYESDLIWKWPEITNKKFIDGAINILNILPEKTIPGVMIGGMGALWALKDIRDSVSLYGSGGLNVWNHMTINELCSNDELLKSITLSPEISREELRKVVSHIHNSDIVSQLEFLVQGNLEALVSEDCLPCVIKDEKIINKLKNSPYTFLGIKDFKNRIFPVEIDAECRTHISNSVELCLLDHIPYLQDMGFNSLVIDSRSKPSDYVHTMISLYQEALELTTAGEPHLEKRLHSLKIKVKKISNGGITTGNFLRGVHDDN
ncbi:MAG: DUF3656 domain-containing protein [Methanobacterium sp.]|nr:DUF3656 domain-containing protein [Methanobacterium sp.]